MQPKSQPESQPKFGVVSNFRKVESTMRSRRLSFRGAVACGCGLAMAAVFSLASAGVGMAQTTPTPPAPTPPAPAPQAQPQKPVISPVMQTVTVNADNTLLEPEATGSRLGLTPLETPAAVFSITPDTFETRGYEQIEDAVDSLPGVTSGGSPADPSQFAVRGFVGNYVSMLRDGIYVGPANMVTRSENAFNLQSVDLLSGPGSVLYGQGSVGGTVNVVTKKPVFAPVHVDAYSAYGSFNTYEEGIGAGGQIAKNLAFRSDLSYYHSDGYVVNSNPKNLNGTGSLLYAPNSKVNFLLALDVLKDDLPSYYGTPLVSAAFGTSPLTGVLQTNDGTGRVLDSRTRYLNYNVGDAQLNSSSYQPSLTINWLPKADLAITNQTYYYHAARNWMNAEQYIFIAAGATDDNGGIAPINEIERDRFQVHHNQQLPGNALNFVYSHKLLGKANKLSAGYDVYHISFSRARGFNFANNYADFVDVLHPIQGTYADPVDPGDNAKRIAPTRITDNAVFAEDALNLTSKLVVVGGLHFENFYLQRLNFGPTGAPQPANNFSGTYHPFDGRVGAVYSLAKNLSLYGQFTTGKTPPGSNIFLVNQSYDGNGNPIPFKLSGAKEGELGVKAALPKNFGELSLAIYDISVNNILTVTQTSSSTNNGQQKSKGFEFSSILHPVHLVDVNFNTAYTDATFGTFFDPNVLDKNGSPVSDAGKHPADIPATTTNLWADIRRIGTVPLELGGGLRFVGARYANNNNNIKLDNYATVDIYATYHFTEKLSFSARGKNLTDKAYASWADVNYPSEIVLERRGRTCSRSMGGSSLHTPGRMSGFPFIAAVSRWMERKIFNRAVSRFEE